MDDDDDGVVDGVMMVGFVIVDLSLDTRILDDNSLDDTTFGSIGSFVGETVRGFVEEFVIGAFVDAFIGGLVGDAVGEEVVGLFCW